MFPFQAQLERISGLAPSFKTEKKETTDPEKKQEKGRDPQNTMPRAVGPRLLCPIANAACGLAGFMQQAGRILRDSLINTVYFKNIKALIPKATAAVFCGPETYLQDTFPI